MKKLLLSTIILLIFMPFVHAQTETNVEELLRLAQKHKEKWNADRQEVIEYAIANNIPVRIETDSNLMEIQYIDQFGQPQYYSITNIVAAATVGTDRVNNGGDAGYSLDGSGMTIHEWDGGGVQDDHQEFGTRVTQGDSPADLHYHSTHVAGTLIAAGAVGNAKGMASAADLEAYDWNSDDEEMADAAAAGALISNHSYGYTRGWSWNSSTEDWDWYGSTSVSNVEDYLFGFYDSYSADWDEIAYNAPYFLICKSAGNDRGDGPGTTPSTAEKDGGDSGYDCIGQQGVAKNILTVGAVGDIPNGYEQPSDVVMSSFSSWGPADDGRIKPDIVANGVGVYSSYYNSDEPTATNYYASLNGTSMATPSAAGSMLLLQEHYEDLNGTGIYMRSATLKGIVIHTAFEAGPNDGPDYMFGWGLLNMKAAADKISEDQTTEVIVEETLSNNGTFTKNITATSDIPIKVTIVWTDRKGTPTSAELDPSDAMLVRDLDLRVDGNTSGTTYYPWSLDRNNPSNAATNSGENNIDNVEVVYIESPNAGETYTITVDHDGNNTGGQAFSMIISAFAQEPEAKFAADITTATLNEQISLTDLSINNPTSWTWTISPATYNFLNSTTTSSQDIDVEFTAEGTYTVSLYVQNANGNDTKVKTDYISIVDAPTGYCIANSADYLGHIDDVTFNTITNNNSGYTDIGGGIYYQDFTSLETDVNLLDQYSLYVHNSYDNTYEEDLDLGVWIDWNRDGDFDDLGEDVICEFSNYGEGTFDISIPADAELGKTRMRIRAKFYDDDCGSSCGETTYGEVEDYILNIRAGTLTWDGSVSTDWEDPDNWSGGVVPDDTFNVIIPDAASVPNSPVIELGTTAICLDCTLETGANLTCNGDLTLTLEP